mmetsp:Transcript_58043/g.154290  ORF Transcript_58043/g.154290 Transcript_58043/m.154290 type:complete len:221 (+) Transcript_58043:239-901(+)
MIELVQDCDEVDAAAVAADPADNLRQVFHRDLWSFDVLPNVLHHQSPQVLLVGHVQSQRSQEEAHPLVPEQLAEFILADHSRPILVDVGQKVFHLMLKASPVPHCVSDHQLIVRFGHPERLVEEHALHDLEEREAHQHLVHEDRHRQPLVHALLDHPGDGHPIPNGHLQDREEAAPEGSEVQPQLLPPLLVADQGGAPHVRGVRGQRDVAQYEAPGHVGH